MHSIIVVAEGVYPVMELKEEIEKRTGNDTRVSILGHTQRGGTPSAVDRIMASCMGKAAVDCIIGNQKNLMMAYREEKVHPIPLAEIVKGNKTPELDMFEIARMLSI